MFSPTSAFHHQFQTAGPHSSPLSPRSTNVPSMAAPFTFGFSKPVKSINCFNPSSMPPSPPTTPPFNSKTPQRHLFTSEQTPDQTTQPAKPIFSFTPTQTPSIPPRRTANLNPLSVSAEERRKKRRDEFLEGVRAKRERDLFDGRGDRLLYLDHVSEQRAWELERARAALEIETVEDGDVGDDVAIKTPGPEQASSVQPDDEPAMVVETEPDDAAALEDLLEAERRELEALVAMHEDPQEKSGPSSTKYWDSDEDEDMDFEGELWRLGEVAGEDDMDIDLSQG